ncbi:MAG: 50S ribosomal protein L1 [Myxococcota bacterium]|nr:50S ribosomal protein L1 [Myxococcota bacterium]
MPKHGKKMRDALARIDRTARYSLEDGIALAKDIAFAKFDESVDLAVNLNVNPRHADQMVRGACVLPHGLGKTVRVAVFAKGDKAEAARAAGADIVGDEDLVAKIQGGWVEFDKCIATPDMMRFVGRVGKILGPRGLMPNPKVGTVTMNVENAVKEAKSGRLEFRVEKAGIVHTTIGRRSFETQQLVDNAVTLIDQLQRLRPASVKGAYFVTIAVSTTHGPGIKIDEAEVLASLKAA